ncbi:MAG: hypothetical protein KA100_01285 [Rickettsiales bacterium]|nr:hypothetical protein [Rickettsiales bacterium]
MQNLSQSVQKFSQKKGRSFLLLPFFLFVVSCSQNYSRYGRVTLHSNVGKDTFSFSVSEEFTKLNSGSPKDKKNPKMTEAEADLLASLLEQRNYCLSKKGSPLFSITSRQEKIYDMTFAHLIEQNYNSKPVAPRTYFGRCVKE